MSDKRDELPRDLRALCGGTVEDEDGSQRTLVFPADSYANICSARADLELAIDDPDTLMEHIDSLREELELVKRLQADMEQRILNHFEPRRRAPSTKDNSAQQPKVDHGAKSKVEKAIADAKAGRARGRKSKTLQAVLKSLAFSQEKGRVPSHAELKELGFNDQQATDAGRWLVMQNALDTDPLFWPLPDGRGRSNKK
ncbi:hypothetical protein HZ994_18050 [Akkermansiaceae bacterium]|nr:hypothetical protein HZ994_18050 [Akkermansiaceae bacterium]